MLQSLRTCLDLCPSMLLASLRSDGVLFEELFLLRACWSVVAMIQLRLMLSLRRLDAVLGGFNELIPLSSSLMVVGLPLPSSNSPLNNGF